MQLHGILLLLAGDFRIYSESLEYLSIGPSGTVLGSSTVSRCMILMHLKYGRALVFNTQCTLLYGQILVLGSRIMNVTARESLTENSTVR